jgi:Raf kinase inhibitor-like YbhB/YbcL family protein
MHFYKFATMKGKFRLRSPAFNFEETIPKKYTGQGEDINPPLKWENPPEGVQSYALIVDDPDAPGGLFTHWLVKDIPSDITEIKEGTIPGKEIISSWKVKKWKGPMPPSGTHRYNFKLYAMNKKNMTAENLKDFYTEAEKDKLDEAVLTGVYAKV